MCSRGSPQRKSGDDTLSSPSSPPASSLRSNSSGCHRSTFVRSTRSFCSRYACFETSPKCARHCFSRLRTGGSCPEEVTWLLGSVAAGLKSRSRGDCGVAVEGELSFPVFQRRSESAGGDGPAIATADEDVSRRRGDTGARRGDVGRGAPTSTACAYRGTGVDTEARAGSWRTVALARSAFSICLAIHPSRRSRCIGVPAGPDGRTRRQTGRLLSLPCVDVTTRCGVSQWFRYSYNARNASPQMKWLTS